MNTRYVVLYESADNGHEKAPVHYPAHSERLDAFHERGTLLLVGRSATRRRRARWRSSRRARRPRP